MTARGHKAPRPLSEQTPLLHDPEDPSKSATDSDGNHSIVTANPEAGAAATEQNVIPDPISRRKLYIILGTLYLGIFLGALDSTIIATLSAPISNSFNSLRLFSWLASSYLISNAACQPLSGRLTDIFTRRTGLVLSNVVFAIGNLICALAKSQGWMITGRAVAGIGGGGLMSISTFVTSDLVPLRKRGLYQGVGNICFGLGASLGGLFGGWVNDIWGWRVAFFAQVPPAIVSAILVYVYIDVPAKHSDKSRLSRVDFLGSGVLVVALVLILLGLNSGGNTVPWTHPLVLVSLPLSLVGLAAFVYVELYVASEPVIPLRLLGNRSVLCACLDSFFMSMAYFAICFYVPIYFQIRGYSAFDAGKRLIPAAVGASISSLAVGWSMNRSGRYKLLIVIVNLIVMLSVALLCTINLRQSAGPVFVYMFMAGFGYGGLLTTNLGKFSAFSLYSYFISLQSIAVLKIVAVAVISAVPHDQQAVITSGTYLFRSTGSTIGITLASAVFQNLLRSSLYSHFPPTQYPGSPGVIDRIVDSLDQINNLPPGWKDGVMSSYVTAMRAVFAVNTGIAVIGTGMGFGVREYVLHKTLTRNLVGVAEA